MEKNYGHVYDNITGFAQIKFSSQVTKLNRLLQPNSSLCIRIHGVLVCPNMSSVGGGLGDDGEVPTFELHGWGSVEISAFRIAFFIIQLLCLRWEAIWDFSLAILSTTLEWSFLPWGKEWRFESCSTDLLLLLVLHWTLMKLFQCNLKWNKYTKIY